MGERAEEIHARALAAADGEGRLPPPPVHEWETFPFEAPLRVRPLRPPADEPPRLGEDAADCWRCRLGDADAIWSDERWLLTPAGERPTGLPLVVILQPRAHADIEGLDEVHVADLGPLLVRTERAVRAAGEIGRVHIGRWGDGSFHFHVWFIARPARLPQLRTSFAAIWDDILPPTPEPVWRANLASAARALAEGGGRAHV